MISPKKKPGTKKSREQKKLDVLLKKVKKLKKRIKSLKRSKKRSKKKESILEKKLNNINNINNYYDYEGEREEEREIEMGTEERERKPGYSDNDERFIGSLSELRQSLSETSETSETSSTNKGKGANHNTSNNNPGYSDEMLSGSQRELRKSTSTPPNTPTDTHPVNKVLRLDTIERSDNPRKKVDFTKSVKLDFIDEGSTSSSYNN